MTMRFIIILLFFCCTAQAVEPAPEPPAKLKYSFSEGRIGTEPLRIESSRIGGTTLSTGSLGKKPVNTLTIRLDRTELTTGTIGNESIEVITITPQKD